jgi:hypothetical protein
MRDASIYSHLSKNGQSHENNGFLEDLRFVTSYQDFCKWLSNYLRLL